MIYHDRKSYEQRRDTILKLLKPIKIGLMGLVALSAIGCYNAAMMRVSGESREACQNDSDCPAYHMCVRNISASSNLGECIHLDDYDPWANRQLEDIIKLKNKKKTKKDTPLETPKTKSPDLSFLEKPDDEIISGGIREAILSIVENAVVEVNQSALRGCDQQKINDRKKQYQCIQQGK